MGNKLWTRLFGGAYYEQAWGIDVDSEGNILVGGGTGSDLDGVEPMGGGDSDCFIRKMDPHGNRIWTVLGGSPYSDSCFALKVDSRDDIYVSGSLGGPAEGVDWVNWSDIVLVKVSTDGTVIRARSFGGLVKEFGLDLAINAHDNPVMTGWTDSNLGGALGGARDVVYIVSGGRP